MERPTTSELTQAVREFLERDVMPAVEGRVAFHVRVATNVLGIIERELADGAAVDARQRARVAALLGQDPETSLDDLNRELAAAIRAGRFDDRDHEVRDVVRTNVAEQLAIANPRYATE
jgi:Domain of unknown function (DUF6285)